MLYILESQRVSTTCLVVTFHKMFHLIKNLSRVDLIIKYIQYKSFFSSISILTLFLGSWLRTKGEVEAGDVQSFSSITCCINGLQVGDTWTGNTSSNQTIFLSSGDSHRHKYYIILLGAALLTHCVSFVTLRQTVLTIKLSYHELS